MMIVPTGCISGSMSFRPGFVRQGRIGARHCRIDQNRLDDKRGTARRRSQPARRGARKVKARNGRLGGGKDRQRPGPFWKFVGRREEAMTWCGPAQSRRSSSNFKFATNLRADLCLVVAPLSFSNLILSESRQPRPSVRSPRHQWLERLSFHPGGK